MSKLLIQSVSEGYQWQRFSHDNPQGTDGAAGSGDFSALLEAIKETAAELWLVLPGEHFFLKSIEYAEKEKRHLSQTIPYQLEELLVDDIDELHVALGQPKDGRVAVAACQRDWLADQLVPFIEADIDISYVVPEPLLVNRESDWALRISDGRIVAHTGEGEGFALEPELALQGLHFLQANSEQETQQLRITADDQQSLDDFTSKLEQAPELEIDTAVQSWQQSIDAASAPEVDLRQGEFGRRLPLHRWWGQWQRVAIVAGVTLAVYLLVNAVQYNVLQDRNLALRQQIEKEFRTVVPRGAIVDAERQLRSKLKGTGNSSGSSAAVATLAKVAPVIAANQELILRALNYNSDNSEMRLSFWAKSFNDIEQVRAKIAELGMEVELVQASADGEGHQARLRIKSGATG